MLSAHTFGMFAFSPLTGWCIDRIGARPVAVAGTLLLVALGVKLGVFPFHSWLPAVYTGVHPSVAAMLSGAVANIGAYGLLRFGAGMLPREFALAAPALILIGVLSILYGGILAVARYDPAAVVAYSAIGQVGYIMIAVAIGGTIGYAAAILFMVINALNKTLLFLAGHQSNRYAGLAYAVGGLSVASIPPAAGFWGKAALLRTALAAESDPGRLLLAAIVVCGGVLSLLYMFQSYGRTFWHNTRDPEGRVECAQTAIVVAGAVFTLLIGLWPQPLLALSERAAAVLQRGTP
jgi:multicomponent Na+:H+ antiporter subunit D